MSDRPQILFLGPKWRGSDARALANELRAEDCTLVEVDVEDFFPLLWSSPALRVLRRLIRPLCAANYNREVARTVEGLSVDFTLVFKGMMLSPQVLARLPGPRYCFYPDVSFDDHGGNIRACLPHYDCLFTTKPFHMTDQDLRSQVRDIQRVYHGADPELHRPRPQAESSGNYECDISFIGCWSLKKERQIRALARVYPQATIAIWGVGWARADPTVRRHWRRRCVFGDELVLAYQASRINLGLLSEAGTGTAVGDETTARTWQIPSCGACMLHERTDELLSVFSEDIEVACFGSDQELVTKTGRLLEDDDLRQSLASGGLATVRAPNFTFSYAHSARIILQYHEQLAHR